MFPRKNVVIIGSGMAGLFAGALLAREGYQVTVLEKEPVAGGLLASFKIRGSSFDTGLHYVGALGPGQILRRYFESLDLFSLCEFEAMDADAFEEYCFPDFRFQVPVGMDRYADRLAQMFPAEAQGIHDCLADWHRIAGNFPLYNLNQETQPQSELEALSDPIGRMSLEDYLDSRIRDPRLKAILSANNGLYGVPPKECPVYMHALIADSFLQGAWKVNGPSQQLAQALVQRIEEKGGRIRTRAQAVKIHSDHGRATAVELADGERLEADWFLCTIHPKQVLGLLAEHAVRPIYRQRVRSLDETCSVYGLFVSFKEPGWPFPKRNVFIHQSMDMGRQFEENWNLGSEPHTIFVSPSDYEQGRARTLSVLCPMRWELWAEWQGSTRQSRPEAYRAFKQRVAEALLARLEAHYPGIGAQVDFWQAATPLTFLDYTGSWQGSAYGIKKQSQALREATLSVRTRLENFFLAGQSIVLPGVVGVTISAVAAAGAIAGFPKLLKRFKK